MENTSKALIMAAGVLIGIMLLATYAFVIRGISIWPQAQEEMISSDQVAAFNEEYEVYKKSRMYGVDVLSCLNKAYSNNEKYDSSQEKFAAGKKVVGKNNYNSAYVINVFVKIKSPLKETLRVFYVDSAGKRREYLGEKKPHEDYTLADTNFYPLIGSPIRGGTGTYGAADLYTTFRTNTALKPTSVNLTGDGFLMPDIGPITRIEDDDEDEDVNVPGYYALLTKDEMNMYEKLMYDNKARTFSYDDKFNGVLEHLLEYTGHDMKQSYKPTKSSGIPPTEWVEAIWETAVYDFKTKQFTCDYIHYNPRTGLVDQIWFSEV